MIALALASGTGDPRIAHGVAQGVGPMEFLALINIVIVIAVLVAAYKLATRAVVALEKIADRLGDTQEAQDDQP